MARGIKNKHYVVKTDKIKDSAMLGGYQVLYEIETMTKPIEIVTCKDCMFKKRKVIHGIEFLLCEVRVSIDGKEFITDKDGFCNHGRRK